MYKSKQIGDSKWGYYMKKGGIAYLILNRPKAHNAIDPETVIHYR